MNNARQQGWTLYRELRRLRTAEPDTVAEDEAGRFIRDRVPDVMPLLARPDLCFSLLLSELHGLAKRFAWIPVLLETVGALQFRPEDSQRFRPPTGPENGFDSLVEKWIRTVYRTAREMERAPESGLLAPRVEAGLPVRDAMQDYFEWAADFVATHAAAFPAQEWFPYYEGRLQIMAGRREAARPGICAAVRKQPVAFWTWENLARTFEDPAMRIACLCKAVLCRGAPPEYLVNTRAWLGSCLWQAGLLDAAKTEIEAVMAIRRRKNWPIPRAILELTRHPSYPAATAGDNPALLREHAALAEAALWDACGIAPDLAVVVRVDNTAGKTRVALGPDRHCNVSHRHHAQIVGRVPGDRVMVRTEIFRHPEYGEIPRALTVDAAGDGALTVEWVRRYRDVLRCKPAGFGFAGDVFVPPPLIQESGATEGDRAGGIAVLERSPRRREPGWRAVTLTIEKS